MSNELKRTVAFPGSLSLPHLPASWKYSSNLQGTPMSTMRLMSLRSPPSPNATVKNINLSFVFPSTNSETILSRYWSAYWAWNWVRILLLGIGAAPIGSYCKGPILLLKYTKHSAVVARFPYISVNGKLLRFSISSSANGPNICSNYVSPWFGLQNAAKNILGRSGLISTDKGSVSPKDCTISSFSVKLL